MTTSSTARCPTPTSPLPSATVTCASARTVGLGPASSGCVARQAAAHTLPGPALAPSLSDPACTAGGSRRGQGLQRARLLRPVLSRPRACRRVIARPRVVCCPRCELPPPTRCPVPPGHTAKLTHAPTITHPLTRVALLSGPAVFLVTLSAHTLQPHHSPTNAPLPSASGMRLRVVHSRPRDSYTHSLPPRLRRIER